MSLKSHGRLSNSFCHAVYYGCRVHQPNRLSAITTLNPPTVASRYLNLRVSFALGCQFRTYSHSQSSKALKVRRIRQQRSVPGDSQLQKWTSSSSETIFALSTPPGRSAVAIVRISGPACKDIYSSLCPMKALPKPRYASVRAIYAPEPKPQTKSLKYPTNSSQAKETREIIDPSALVLYFPAPRTVTGEDVLELHVHGSIAIIQRLLRAIPECANLTPDVRIRPAEPGEFTRRAFMSGRMDLMQAEALGDLLSAETERQRHNALRGTEGALGRQYEEWRAKLLEARGELEALIDFAEDQQFEEKPQVLVANVRRQVFALNDLVALSIRNAVRGELLRNGIKVTVLGRPNAGKSSLLNIIAGRDAAIVSPTQGTTRDIVEVTVDIDGWAVRLSDTAGLRPQPPPARPNRAEERAMRRPGYQRPPPIDPVEIEGMHRAVARAKDSDVLIFLLEVEPKPPGNYHIEIEPHIVTLLSRCVDTETNFIVAINKIDNIGEGWHHKTLKKNLRDKLEGHCSPERREKLKDLDFPIVPVSCKFAKSSKPLTKARGGVPELLEALTTIFGDMTSVVEPSQVSADTKISSSSETPSRRLVDNSFWQESLGATERQRFLLQKCFGELHEFLDIVDGTYDEDENGEIDIVLAAESLRNAADCLARVTGRGESGDVEEVLGVVFSKFCVGK